MGTAEDTGSDPGREARLAEERFLLAAQKAMQHMLNEKGLRYRDLARRLGVSEARVSHMFGDDAANLTLRTLAKVFHCLGESAVIISAREYERKLSDAAGQTSEDAGGWRVAAPDFVWVDRCAEPLHKIDSARDTTRPATTRQWALADEATYRRRGAG
jgi:DNA-binding Xre family transcriptional regulator